MPASSATSSGLADRYATALFELAHERDALDAVATDVHALSSMIDESDELERMLASPVVTRDEQSAAIEAIAARAGFGDLTRQFLGVMAHQRRLFVLPSVINAYDRMLSEHRGEVAAEVTSAVPLSEEQLAAVRDSVGQYAGKSVTLDASVDPGLLGGLVVRVGSHMIDASLRTKLQQLELSMRGIG